MVIFKTKTILKKLLLSSFGKWVGAHVKKGPEPSTTYQYWTLVHFNFFRVRSLISDYFKTWKC
jgi:hypothetical protein